MNNSIKVYFDDTQLWDKVGREIRLSQRKLMSWIDDLTHSFDPDFFWWNLLKIYFYGFDVIFNYIFLFIIFNKF